MVAPWYESRSSKSDIISPSTMMAEYYALSTAMRGVLPLRNLVKRVDNALGLEQMCNTTFKCTAHKDNQACQTFANLEPGRQTPRSKFFDNKVHWFREHLSSDITVVRVDITRQIGDIFTKPLTHEPFERLRKLLSGY